MKVVGIGRGSKLGDLCIEGDHVPDFDRAEDGGLGRENHDTSRD